VVISRKVVTFKRLVLTNPSLIGSCDDLCQWSFPVTNLDTLTHQGNPYVDPKDQGQQTDPWRLGRTPKQVSRKSFRFQNMGCRGYTVMYSRIWERCWDRLTVPAHGAGIPVEGHITTTLCLNIDAVNVVQCTAAGAGSLPTNDTELFDQLYLLHSFPFLFIFFVFSRTGGGTAFLHR